ncbi:MAG: TolC family outer membrane protein [Gammaproteobacteria bacterium]|nr:TolC family outer membrane protein [Gammaproteobacteria bacterium]
MLVSSSHAVSLQDFVADVIQSNPQVLQRIHSYRQIVEDENIATSGWRPTVDLTASAGSYETNSPLTSFQDKNYDSENIALTLTQNLFNGFDTSHAESQAKARVRSELHRVYDEADNIAITAIGYYVDALKQRQLVKLAERNVESHKNILQKIHLRNASGVGRRSEKEQTMGRLAQAQAGLLAQKNNLQDSLTMLHFILGRYVLEEELENPVVPVMPQEALNLLLDKAIIQHPAMKSANYNIVAAEFEHKRSKSSFYPKVDLQLKTMSGNNMGALDGATDENSVMVNLTYNLYNGNADSAAQRKRLSAVYENRDYAAKVRRQIIETLRLAWMAGNALNGQLKYLDEFVGSATKTSKYYRKEFRVGKRGLLDILDAEGELNSAMVSRTKAHYDAISAVFRIYEGTGELFSSLALSVDMSGDDLRLIALNVKVIDTLPFNPDGDVDKEIDTFDHCDNTLPESTVNEYGCIGSSKEKFEYVKVELDEPEIRMGEVHLEQLNFIFNSNELTEAAMKRLNAVISSLKKLVVNATVEVYAHTDSKGSSKYNAKLSQRRANKVKSILIESGFDASLINAIGRGEEHPIADNKTSEGRAKNRRVEFLVQEIKPAQKINTTDKPSLN